MSKYRVQYRLYSKYEGDVINFIEGLRKFEKRVVFVHAMRAYMKFTGFYDNSNFYPDRPSREKLVETDGECNEFENRLLAMFPDNDDEIE